MLSKEQMLAKSKRNVEKVHIEAWGDDVFMRGMTGGERNSLSLFAKDKENSTPKKFVMDPVKYVSGLIARCLCDEKGERIFTDDETHLIDQFDGDALDELQENALRLNGGDEEEAEKNS